MKKLLAILLALAMVFAIVAACGGEDDKADDTPSGGAIKVGIVNLHPSESGYREANVADMDNVFNAANGYEVLKANYNTVNEQLDAAQQFINDRVEYLLISAADASGWDSVQQAAKDAGITVFLFDRLIDASSDLYAAAVISDMVNQGKNAVAWLEAQARPGGYKFIHINGQMGSAAQIGRAGPLVDAVAAKDDWEIVREGTGGDTWSADEAKKIVEAAIQAGEDFNVIYAHNDGMAEGAMIALQEAGISHGVDGDVWIMGFDFNKFALRYVQSGEWNFNGQCSPFQAAVIDGFIKTLEGGGTISVPANKQVINDEIITDHATITDAFIAQYGLGDDPGPRDGVAAPPSAGTTPKVGIVNLHPSESGYREANVADMDRVFNADNGYEVYKANYNTLNEQLDAAQQFINDGVDYLLISAADANGWEGVLQSAKDAGIVVFLFDRMINISDDYYEAAVISDMETQGKNAVAWLEAQNRDGGYKFIHINGQMGSAAQIGRAGPLVAAVDAKDDWTIVREGTGGDTWSADEAKAIVEAAIQAGEDFNVIYAHNDGMAEGAMKALQEAGISHGVDGDVWIMGFDFNKFALRYVQSGEWNYNGQCSPFQADVIHGFIQTLEAGGSLGLASKTVINAEIDIDTARIDDAFIAAYGLGDDPGPR